MIWNEEYVRARAPGRVSVLGEGLLGPTLIHYGTEEQKARFLPPIRAGTELWCQGYSEPDAGSDLANVATRAVLDGDEWVVTGQKVWTSLAHQADWCFVVCRTEPGSARHRGLSYLLVPMDQPGVEVRPIEQLTRTSEFNEVFFDGARTDRANVVGAVGDGWRVALATLAFERGVALLGHQLSFRREFDHLVEVARRRGPAADPVVRQRLAGAYAELAIMRYNTLRSLSGVDGPVAPPEASIAKLYWGGWHRPAGRAGHGRAGPGGHRHRGPPYELGDLQRSFLFSRSETIYGGSDEIQRNIIGERVLGLPPEPKGAHEPRPASSIHRRRPPRRPATACSRAGWWWSRRRPAPASASPPPGAASRRGRRWWSPTPTSGGWPSRPTSWPALAGAEAAGRPLRRHRRGRRPAPLPAAVLERHGHFDVAVHNAGLGGTVPLVEMTDEQWAPGPRRHLDRHLPLHPGRPHPPAAPARPGSSSTTPRCSAGGPSPARPTTPRPRPGSWPSPAARPPRRHRPGCGSTPCRPAWPSTPS